MKKIDPKRWQRIEALMDEALDLEPGDREAHVRKRADGDEELIAQVLKMLAASDKAETFLDNTNRSDLEAALARMSSPLEKRFMVTPTGISQNHSRISELFTVTCSICQGLRIPSFLIRPNPITCARLR